MLDQRWSIEFRRLVIAVYDEDGRELASQQISRSFALRDGVWAPVVDHTLADGETRSLRFPRASRWRATFRYGDPRFEAGLPPAEVAIELAGGL